MASILIADDEEDARVGLGMALEEAGHEITYAYDGEQAVQSFRDIGFDVVVMDLVMPVKNGLLAIQEIRKDYPHAIIIAVSDQDLEDLPVAEEYGAAAAIAKPLSPEQICAAVDQVLETDRGSGWGAAPVMD